MEKSVQTNEEEKSKEKAENSIKNSIEAENIARNAEKAKNLLKNLASKEPKKVELKAPSREDTPIVPYPQRLKKNK